MLFLVAPTGAAFHILLYANTMTIKAFNLKKKNVHVGDVSLTRYIACVFELFGFLYSGALLETTLSCDLLTNMTVTSEK